MKYLYNGNGWAERSTVEQKEIEDLKKQINRGKEALNTLSKWADSMKSSSYFFDAKGLVYKINEIIGYQAQDLKELEEVRKMQLKYPK